MIDPPLRYLPTQPVQIVLGLCAAVRRTSNETPISAVIGVVAAQTSQILLAVNGGAGRFGGPK